MECLQRGKPLTTCRKLEMVSKPGYGRCGSVPRVDEVTESVAQVCYEGRGREPAVIMT